MVQSRVADMTDAGMFQLTDNNFYWFRSLMSKYGRIVYKLADIFAITMSPLATVDSGGNENVEDESEEPDIAIGNDDESGLGSGHHDDDEEFYNEY
jgi:hypothetical protein